MKEEILDLALVRYQEAWEDYTAAVDHVISLILASRLQWRVKNNLLFGF